MKRYFLNCCFVFFGITAFAQTIVVGQGSGSSTSAPVASWYNSSASESIYRGSEIGRPIEITNIAYKKASGASSEEPYIQIYLKMTSVDGLSANYTASDYGFADYTLVYEGTLPNNSLNGWMDVTLQNSFAFDDVSQNLSVLVTGFTCIGSGRPQYTYTSMSGTKLSSTFNDGTIGCDGDNPWSEYSEMKPVWERPNISLSGIFLNARNFNEKNDILITHDNDKMTISSHTAIRDLVIYDAQGKQVLSKSDVNQSDFQITLPQTQRGLFILKVSDIEGKTLTKKIIL